MMEGRVLVLSITRGQMDALGAHSMSAFEVRVAAHIQSVFPDRTRGLSSDKLRAAIGECVRKAQGYGIEMEDDIRRFIEYVMIYGWTMDARPESAWIGDILRRTDIDGTTKMDVIDQTDLDVQRSRGWRV